LALELTGCPFFERCHLRIPGTCDVLKPARAEILPGHSVACFLHSPAVGLGNTNFIQNQKGGVNVNAND
jgi:hypothetical protein